MPSPASKSADVAGSELSDEQLVVLALNGQADAYRQLVERFQRPVYSLILRLVRHPQTAEDLAQESFVRAFQRLDSFKPEATFSSWLFKVAHNRTIDFLRRKQHVHIPLEAEDSEGGSTWEFLQAPDYQSPDRQSSAKELGQAMEQALAGLKDNYRQALLLRFQAGLSYQEIADALETSMANVKVLLHRARKQFQQALEEVGFGDSEPPS